MKKLFACFLGTFFSLCVFAQNSQKVADLAGLLTQPQIAQLDLLVRDFIQEHKIDLVLCSTADAQGKDETAFADDYFDYEGYGLGSGRDGILLLIDMDNRAVAVSTSGSAIRDINDSEVERILDSMFKYVRKGDYFKTFEAGIKSVSRCIVAENGGSGFYFQIPSFKMLLVFFLLSLAAGGVAVGFVIIKYRAKSAKDNYPFNSNADLDLTQTRDLFIKKDITSRRIARNSSSGGGGGSSHTSSSGRSHGGGSRHF